VKDYLVIDSDNYAKHGIEAFFFPGGEPHVKIPDFSDKDLLLFLKLRTWNDVGLAAALLNTLSYQTSAKEGRVFVPYFPGARQDRTDGNSPLTLDIMAALLAFGDTVVFDPHSPKTTQVIDSVSARAPSRVLMPSDLDLSGMPKYDGVIAPDKGAVDRAYNFASALSGTPVYQCEKERDFASGRIVKYNAPPLRPGRYLVVDDICDGGATFLMLADAVGGAGIELDLWVSHGIFSRGVQSLKEKYKNIFTTDSWYQHKLCGGVSTFSLRQLFDKIMES
jgi:ribose-phosphate pyrophosphokinase